VLEQGFLFFFARFGGAALLFHLGGVCALLLFESGSAFELIGVFTLIFFLIPQSSKESLILLVLHLKFLNFSGHINVLTYDIQAVAIDIPVGKQEIVRIESDDRFCEIHPLLDLEGEDDSAILGVGHLCDLVESDIVLVILLRDGHAIDLVAHAFCVFFEPVEWDDIGINLSCRSDQVRDHRDETR
jgi:hypothetical protein